MVRWRSRWSLNHYERRRAPHRLSLAISQTTGALQYPELTLALGWTTVTIQMAGEAAGVMSSCAVSKGGGARRAPIREPAAFIIIPLPSTLSLVILLPFLILFRLRRGRRHGRHNHLPWAWVAATRRAVQCGGGTSRAKGVRVLRVD